MTDMVDGVEVIQDSRDLVIRNMEQLPRGTGAGFLRCIRSHKGELIAAQWARKATSAKPGEVLVVFTR